MLRVKGLSYLCVLLMAVALAVFEADLLYKLQEQNLFMRTPLFFQQRMVVAGGLLSWAGSYLTQYFYYPLFGAGLLCLLWAFFVWLQGRVLGRWQVVRLVPVACLLLTIATLGYWTYYLKLPGHAFVATLGSVSAVGLAGIGSWFGRRSRWAGLAFLVLTLCGGYPLLGFYALWAAALMMVLAWRSERRAGVTAVVVAVGLIGIIGVPLACYQYVYHTTPLEHIYWAALPVYCRPGQSYPLYYLPYALLVASTLLMAALKPVSLRQWGQRGVVAATLMVVALCWHQDDNLHRELSMSRSMWQADWAGMLKTAVGTKGEPTRLICLMRNLALFRTGQQAAAAAKYPDGGQRPQAPFSTRAVHTEGKMLYLQYGLPNYCYRWCMEDGVEYGWTVEKLKLMTMCSLLNGEYVAAQRFVNMLKKTDFHQSWAKRYEAYIHNPRLAADDPLLAGIPPLLRTDNFLTADRAQLELFLIEHILSTTGETRELQDLATFTMNYYRHNRHQLFEE